MARRLLRTSAACAGDPQPREAGTPACERGSHSRFPPATMAGYHYGVGESGAKRVTSTMVLTPRPTLGLQTCEVLQPPELFELAMHLGRVSVAPGEGRGLHLEPNFGLRGEDCKAGDEAYIDRSARTLAARDERTPPQLYGAPGCTSTAK